MLSFNFKLVKVMVAAYISACMCPRIGLGDDGFKSFGQRDEDDLDTDQTIR